MIILKKNVFQTEEPGASNCKTAMADPSLGNNFRQSKIIFFFLQRFQLERVNLSHHQDVSLDGRRQ